MRIRPALLWPALLVVAVGCSKPAPLPETPTDDASARTTTAVNPPSPQEMATKCDVPFYTGAQAPDGMSRMPRTDKDGTHYELVLTTHDAPKKVADFYATALKLPAVSGGDRFTVMGKTTHKNDVIVEVKIEGGQTFIRIHSIAYKS